MPKQVALCFRLSPDEALAALRENSMPNPTFPVLWRRARKRYLGQVGDNWFSLRLFPRLLGNNGAGAVFAGTVTSAPEGCRITGTLSPDPMVRALLWLWLVFGICWTVAGAVVALVLNTPSRFALLLSGVGWTILGLTIIGAFWLVGRSQHQKLIESIELTLGERCKGITERPNPPLNPTVAKNAPAG
jgi:hypothetical protein